MHLEEFSGMTPELVLQDFHAGILKEAVTCALLTDVAEEIELATRKRKLTYKACITQALNKMKNTLPFLLLAKTSAEMIRRILDIFGKSLISVEPGRQYPRRGLSGPKVQKHSFDYRNTR